MLSYTDIGTGKAIIFIHGLGSRKEAWLPQHKLSEKYRLIMVDLRGHGETILNENITMENFASDIISLLNHLKVKSAYFCGLSLGGVVAQELYKQKPNMVDGLILANTLSYAPSILEYFGVMDKPTESYESGTLIEDILNRGFYDDSKKESARKAFYIRDSYLDSAKTVIGINYIPYLFMTNKPVLLIGSSHDKVTPLINLQTMKLCMPYAKVVVLDKTGHLSNIEQSEKFNNCIEEFIKQGCQHD